MKSIEKFCQKKEFNIVPTALLVAPPAAASASALSAAALALRASHRAQLGATHWGYPRYPRLTMFNS